MEIIKEMIGFKMLCNKCKEELKKLPFKEAIKSKEWWKQEIKDFRINDILIILAILLIFSGFYFEFGPKIKNPCDWCNIQTTFGDEKVIISCSDWIEQQNEFYNPSNDLKLEVKDGDFKNLYIE